MPRTNISDHEPVEESVIRQEEQVQFFDDVSPPDNSELRKISEDVAGAIQYSFLCVGADNDQQLRTGSVEEIFRKFINTLPGEKRHKLRRNAEAMLQTTPEAREIVFGSAGRHDPQNYVDTLGGFSGNFETRQKNRVDPELLGVQRPSINVPLDDIHETSDGFAFARNSNRYENLGELVEAAKTSEQVAAESDVCNHENICSIYGHRSLKLDVEEPPEKTTSWNFNFKPLNRLHLHLAEIKCIKETKDPIISPGNEISLGGVSVDETGDNRKIKERKIAGGLRTGYSQKLFFGHLEWQSLEWFDISEGQYWPKTYSVMMAIAEKDSGGFQAILNLLYSQIRQKVKEVVAKLVSTPLAPFLGLAIAGAIGKAVAWIVDKLFGWIIHFIGDDVFRPRTISVVLPTSRPRTYNKAWGGKLSPARYVNFYGHGGHFRIKYHWRVSRVD